MSLFDDLISRDATRVLASAGEILRSRDTEALSTLSTRIEEIRAATKDLKLGGTLYPNNAHVARAIAKLEFVRDARGCLCALYVGDDFADPQREAELGRVRITHVDNSKGAYDEEIHSACAACGATYQTSVRSRHFIYFVWTRTS